jgi:hypothetical protein
MTEEHAAWDQARSVVRRADQQVRARIGSRPLLILAMAALLGFLMGRLRQK